MSASAEKEEVLKRVRIEDTGRGADVIIYPVPKGLRDPAARSAAKQCTDTVRQRMNDRTALQKFRRVLMCNFAPGDLVVGLTYRDDALPVTADKAVRQKLKPFFKALRQELRTAGAEELRYVYVTEGLHGEQRLHHHLVIPFMPGVQELVRRCWERNGDVVWFNRIFDRGYDGWARYLSKEPRKTGRARVGQRMWTPSLGLKQPTVTIFDVTDDYEYELPPNAYVERNETYQTEWFTCRYISWSQLSGSAETAQN